MAIASPPSKFTLQWLVKKYEASAAFKALAPSTQRTRSNILKAVCETGGKMLVSQVTRNTIAAGRDRRADAPLAAINFMKVMGYLFEWAVDAGYARANPVRDVKRPKAKAIGHTPWTYEDVSKFYDKHMPGTLAGLAMDLLLFTGLRRSDVYRLGPQHIRNAVVELRAQKNDEPLFIPVHPSLQKSIDACSISHMAFLTTPVQGRPFKRESSFGNWFAEVCDEAGVSGRAHGLRKLLAQIVAESGGSNAELKALFGWTTDAMAVHYIKNANAKKLAQFGAKKLKKNMPSPLLETKAPHLKKVELFQSVIRGELSCDTIFGLWVQHNPLRILRSNSASSSLIAFFATIFYPSYS